MSTTEVRVMRLAHGHDLPLPTYQSALAAGVDLLAAVPDKTPLTIAPGARALVPTGIAIALPAGTEAQVRPRSGLAARHGLTVLNAPGTGSLNYDLYLQRLAQKNPNIPVIIEHLSEDDVPRAKKFLDGKFRANGL